jgi:hypothetical protein
VELVVHRLRHVRVDFADGSRRPTRSIPAARTALDLTLRGFLMGEAIGMLVVAHGSAVATVSIAGILALGAALVSWDR